MNNEIKKGAAEANTTNHQNNNRKKSQKQLILDYLLEGNEITPRDALNKFGCFRLGARIAELREEGYYIRTSIPKGERYAVYTLEGFDD